MVSTRSLVALASLAAANLVNAHVIEKRAPSPLEVKLTTPTGDVAEIVATITNVGAEDLNLLAVGTILDTKLPIERLAVSNEAVLTTFLLEKVLRSHPRVSISVWSTKHSRASTSSCSRLAPRSRPSSTAPACTASTRPGPTPSRPRACSPTPPASSTQLSGSAAYQSNALRLAVTSAPRPAQVLSRLDRRALLQPGCSATEEADMRESLSNCQKLALAAAADAADPASKRFVEYFKSNASETRRTVVNRLTAVAGECGTADSGAARLFCYDYYNVCEVYGPLVAYSISSGPDTMVVCPLFWERPGLTKECHRQDHATTILHETTHQASVYSPKTNDYAYSYDNITKLEPSRALLNADQYSLYANAVHLNC
ncbi:hypothetical protein PG995_009359 [Apiospora arundinis]